MSGSGTLAIAGASPIQWGSYEAGTCVTLRTG
jgi:hypothetical protein